MSLQSIMSLLRRVVHEIDELRRLAHGSNKMSSQSTKFSCVAVHMALIQGEFHYLKQMMSLLHRCLAASYTLYRRSYGPLALIT
jgi:hypothetical protein